MFLAFHELDVCSTVGDGGVKGLLFKAWKPFPRSVSVVLERMREERA